MSENEDPLDFFLKQLIIGSSKEEQIEESLNLFAEIIVEKNCIQPNRARIPYHAITQYIYNYPQKISLDDITLSLDAREMWLEQNMGPLPEDPNFIEKIRECFHKFRDHIVLAVIQKEYIQLAAKEAEKLAVNARSIADKANLTSHNAKNVAQNADLISKNVQRALSEAEYTVEQAQKGAKKALILSAGVDEALERAKAVAEKAENVAQHAQKLATEADAQAKSTIANYISILGIFASIIFTLFGGVNLIGATVKLLEANSRWPYLTFVIALLMICLLTLLNMMIKWINSMSNLRDALDKFKLGSFDDKGLPKSQNPLKKYIGFGFYTRAILALGVVLGISMIGMYNVKKENTFSYSTETTTKNNSDKTLAKDSNEKTNLNANENLKDETTVVSKFTLSNAVKDNKENSDKEE